MTIATLRRTYTAEISHFLPFVCEGHKCGRMHGHSYRVHVFVRGPVGSAGMVCDFAEIDAVAKPVIAKLDHATLNDTIPNPTSEVFCLWLLRKLAAVPHLYAVQVCETDRSACMVTIDDCDAALLRGSDGR